MNQQCLWFIYRESFKKNNGKGGRDKRRRHILLDIHVQYDILNQIQVLYGWNNWMNWLVGPTLRVRLTMHIWGLEPFETRL